MIMDYAPKTNQKLNKTMKKIIKLELLQNWEQVSGVSEKERQKVETYISEDGITFYYSDRSGEKTNYYLTLNRESAYFLADMVNALRKSTPTKEDKE